LTERNIVDDRRAALEVGQDAWALRALRSSELLGIVICIGIALRVAQYLANRSLWIDETWLALNLLSRSFGHLTKPLDFSQGAPIGFLFAEKLVSSVLGFSEYALRLVPLLCGIASLIAFALVARRVLPKAVAPLAALLFAVADGLIYYSSELKPYAGDVTASIVLILAARKLSGNAPVGVKMIAFALAGLVLVAFSFPALFVVAGIAITMTFAAMFGRDTALRPATLVPVFVWVLGSIASGIFAATHLAHIRGTGSNFFYVSDSSSLAHSVNVFGTQLAVTIGLLPPFNQVQKLALLLVIVGVVSLARRDRALLSVLLIPLVLTFAASAVHAYPLEQRTELFLVPMVLLLLVEGVAKTIQWTPPRSRTAVGVVLAVAVAAGPVSLATKHLVHPRQREEVRPVLEFVRERWRAGDTLYLYHYAQYPFLYYERCDCSRLTRAGRVLWPVRAVAGPDEHSQAVLSKTPALVVGHFRAVPQQYVADLHRLKGRGRVWFVYSHFATPGEELFIQHRLIDTLDKMGVRLTSIDRLRAHAYLYDLR
jgi:hypothetical protein